MPRRREVPKRVILPDPKFGSELLTRFINVVMLDGKKSVAEKVVYGALLEAAKKKGIKEDAKAEESEGGEGGEGGQVKISFNERVLQIFETALKNIKPTVEVRSRRVGGATYQIPIEVRPDRARALGMRWLVHAARGRSEKGMMLRLAGEVLDAAENRGTAVKKREDTHRMAEANKAFAHFRIN